MAAGYLCLFPLCVLGATPALAQSAPSPHDGLTLSGSVRLRIEAIENQPRAGFNASDQLAELRTEARLVWKRGPVQLVGEVWDSRAWGANPGTPLSTGEVNAFEPVQAYVRGDLGAALGRGSNVTVAAGRMLVELGSRRLIAADDYRNTTNAFTGLRVDGKARGGWSGTALYLLPQMRLPDDGPALRANRFALDKESFDAVLWGGLVAHRAKGNGLLAEASFLHFGERDAPGRPTRDRSLDNIGLRLQVDPREGRFDGGVEAIIQRGGISASTAPGALHLPVRASFLRAAAGYSFKGPWKPRLFAEFDYAGGDGPGGSFGRFDTLFGFRRGDLAPAGLYNAIGRSNLVSPGLRVEVTPSKRLDGFIGYRALWLADSHDAFSTTGVRDATGASGSFAGHQIDGRVRWWALPRRVRVEFDGTLLARGRFLESAPNGRKGTTRYGSLNLTGFF